MGNANTARASPGPIQDAGRTRMVVRHGSSWEGGRTRSHESKRRAGLTAATGLFTHGPHRDPLALGRSRYSPESRAGAGGPLET
jgi:hypothetical protein